MIKGTFWPAYVLCKSYTTSATRSGYRITKIIDGVPKRNTPRVIFTETFGHDDLINFMSSYQTQDKLRGKHYHPEGYLCWYECNMYGEPTGVVMPIKKVPEYVWIFDFEKKGYKRLKKERERKPKLNEILSTDPRASPLETKKNRLHQNSYRKDKLRRAENASKESRNKRRVK